MTALRWTPSAGLFADALSVVDAAPADGADARFERLAWDALLRDTGPDLLMKAHAPLHVTASAAVLSPDGARTCLVLHAKIGQWVQPGGHLEPPDASVAGAALREVLEETGLAGSVAPVPLGLSRHPAPCRPGVVDWHLDVQFLVVAPAAAPQVSAESRDVRWFPVEALPDDLCGGVDELVELGRAALSRPPRP